MIPGASRILIADNEPTARAVVERALRREGYQVLLASSGGEALKTLEEKSVDLIILDPSLPDISGEDLCVAIRRHRKAQTIPMLVLTGRADGAMAVWCLNNGADDLLVKPFHIQELTSRVGALLRPSRLYRVRQDAVIESGRLTIRVAERRVLWEGRPVRDFAPKEFELLNHLVLHAPKVIDKNALALRAWGVPVERLHQRTLDVHIRRIRQKLGPLAAEHLKTVPVIGFQWVDDSMLRASGKSNPSPIRPSSLR